MNKVKEPKKSTSSPIALRLGEIIEKSCLNVVCVADYIGISISVLNRILNGQRKISDEIAVDLVAAFELNIFHIYDLEKPLPANLRRSARLRKFLHDHKNEVKYFKTKQLLRTDSQFADEQLLPSRLFDSPVYIWEIQQYCHKLGEHLTSARIGQLLDNLVDQQLLYSQKVPIKRRDGSFGDRCVRVYCRVAFESNF